KVAPSPDGHPHAKKTFRPIDCSGETGSIPHCSSVAAAVAAGAPTPSAIAALAASNAPRIIAARPRRARRLAARAPGRAAGGPSRSTELTHLIRTFPLGP